MYEHINKQLSQNQQDIYRLQKIEAMVTNLKKELDAVAEREQAAKVKFEKENKDYEKIINRSVSSIFHAILGSLAERTETERREALEAGLHYNQCVRDLEDIRDQIARLEIEKLQYKNAQAEYDKLYNEKLQIVTNENSKTAHEVMELSKRIESTIRNQLEVDEAISIGREVQSSLTAAWESLNSAESCGVWDMFGGGLIADMAKHSYIDDASDAVQRTHSLLRRFRTELADIQISEEMQIDISSFAKFADFFFDGLIADWFIQSKINMAQESVSVAQNQVQNVMRTLFEMKNVEQKAQEDWIAQRSKRVVEA